MTAHTPGPWASVRNGSYVVPAGHSGRNIGGAIDADLDRNHYAQVICSVHEDKHGRADRAVNARLIAAAPDLLAALRDLHREVARLLQQGRIEVDGASHAERIEGAQASAIAAIARAEGATP